MITPSKSQPKTVAVIGAGITGLSAAHRLIAEGHQVFLFEASSRAGGSIGSERVGGWLIEKGPNSLLDGDPCVAGLLSDLGLQDEVIVANAGAKKRFLVRDAKVQALPSSPPSLFTTRLLSWRLRLSLLTEVFKRPVQRPADLSLGRLVADHFGQEAVDYCLNPMVGGVYAGDPDKLSAQFAFPSVWQAEKEAGSIIRGMIRSSKRKRAEGFKRSRMISFPNGLQTLPDSLVARLPAGVLHLNTPVSELCSEKGKWRVLCEGSSAENSPLVDHVLFAVPAHALASLRINGECVGAPFAKIAHPPVTSLFLGYKRSQVSHPLDGFGVLIPALEKRKELGVLFSSSLFSGRAPEGHVALTVMVGGMRQPELAGLPVSELLATVAPDLRDLLGVSGDPVFQRCTAWPRAIPQYNLGYGEFLELFVSLQLRYPGLHFGGNSKDGISVPNCIRSGQQLAAF